MRASSCRRCETWSDRIRLVKGKGFFTPDSYALDEIESPSERALLEQLLTYGPATQWASRIRARMAALK